MVAKYVFLAHNRRQTYIVCTEVTTMKEPELQSIVAACCNVAQIAYIELNRWPTKSIAKWEMERLLIRIHEQEGCLNGNMIAPTLNKIHGLARKATEHFNEMTVTEKDMYAYILESLEDIVQRTQVLSIRKH